MMLYSINTEVTGISRFFGNKGAFKCPVETRSLTSPSIRPLFTHSTQPLFDLCLKRDDLSSLKIKYGSYSFFPSFDSFVHLRRVSCYVIQAGLKHAISLPLSAGNADTCHQACIDVEKNCVAMSCLSWFCVI